jgi:DNA invertase Pin-like site-specific DNA recombinase
MIAAIYARKSTDQNGIANDEKSVTRQIEHAKAYAAQNGWAVYDEYLYVDDGISGAEFVKRPGFLRLMNALEPKPAFQVLIMSEESRLGREQIETAYALKQIITAGVRVFYYLENRERTLESPTDKLLLSVTAFADEMEREKARQRTHDALVRKARAGYVAGGSVYGYDNIEVTLPDSVTGKPKRLHVERRINEAEAAVIREIFEKAAAGWGPRRIAHDLNARHVPAPPPRRAGRPRAWAPSTIYAMLTRSLYRGEVVWNRTRKRNAWGIKHQTGRAEAEWVQLEVPALRIVPEPLWQAVRERFRDTRASYLRATNGQLWGRPANGIESRYLLTGLAQCGLCGGSLIVHSRASGSRRANAYLCSYSHLRGKTVCPGGLLLPMDLTNEAILKTVEQDILHPEVVRRAMRLVISELNAPADTLVPHRTGLQAELTVLEQELSRLTAAVAQGGDLKPLLDGIQAREQRRHVTQTELAGLEGFRPVAARDLQTLQREVEGRLTDWRGLLRRQVTVSRQILRKLLVGRIVFRQREDGVYEFSGQASLGRLLAGIVCTKAGVAPTGFEPVYDPGWRRTAGPDGARAGAPGRDDHRGEPWPTSSATCSRRSVSAALRSRTASSPPGTPSRWPRTGSLGPGSARTTRARHGAAAP